MEGGWIKLWRKTLDSAVFQDDEIFKLWSLCLFKACHKGKEILFDKTPVKLNAGEFITGRFSLWRDYYTYKDKQGNFHFKPKKSAITIWNWLKILEKMQNINIKSNNKFSIVSIINWSIYQGNDLEIEQQNNNKLTTDMLTDEQQTYTNKNVKNVKKKEISTSFMKFYEAYPKRIGRADAIKAWVKLKPDDTLLELMLQKIELFKQSEDWIKDNGKYIPYPATWLNGKRWEDEPNIKNVKSW